MMRLSRWVRVGVVLATVLCATVAYSSSNGITGKSGKQGSTCNACHQGGKTPTVMLEGPTSLDAGMTAVYTFYIETDAAITGMNAAVSEGTMMGDPDGGATKSEDDEVTHNRTLKPDGGVATYTFSVTAPQYGGKVTLYAAGNAANNNGQTDGDEAASTTLEILVDGPPKPPPPEAGPPPAPTTTTPPAPTTTPDAAVDASVVVADDEPPPPADDGGCAVGSSDRSSIPAGSALGALIALAALVRIRRR